MWKPGNEKPETPSKNTQNAVAGSNSKGASAKKLSGATMGMRFMQRKAEASALVKRQEDGRKAVLQAAARKNNTNVKSNNEDVATNNSSFERKRDSETMSTESSEGVILLEIASVVDMHGVGADVVGRRSFGGFHKVVRSTWETAIKIRTDDDARTKATSQHITDEELLKRYEKYVKGRGGENSNSGSRKDKRKRN